MIENANDPASKLRPRICVIGVGGGGGNAVANMIRNDVQGVEFIVANTDAQALNASPAMQRIQLGRETTQGLGAGSSAAIGTTAALEAIDAINFVVRGAHLCFIAAGMGGGTGTGAAPVIAAAARAQGILTIGVVTKPFGFEGRRRAAAAEEGIEALRQHVDTLIVIPNQNLFRIASVSTTIRQAFDMADAVLEQGVRSISDLIVMPGIINLDFADVRSVMAAMGKAMLGTGEASGENRAIEAAEKAISNPLLDGDIAGAKGLIISIAGGEDMRLSDVDEAAGHIKNLVDPDADIIWGSSVDPLLAGRMRVSIVATGIESGSAQAAIRPEMVGSGVASRPRATPPPPSPAVAGPIVPALIFPRRPTEPGSAASEPAPLGGLQVIPASLPVKQPSPSETLHETSLPLSGPEEDELYLTRFDMIEPEPEPDPGVVPGLRARPLQVASPVLREAHGASRGPSLFQRMTQLATAGANRTHVPPEPEIEESGVYRRRSVGRGG